MAVHPHRSKYAGEDWSEEERELWRQLFDSFLKAEATKDVDNGIVTDACIEGRRARRYFSIAWRWEDVVMIMMGF